MTKSQNHDELSAEDLAVYLDKIKAMPPEQQRLRVVSDLAEPTAAAIRSRGAVAQKSAKLVIVGMDQSAGLEPFEVVKRAWRQASYKDRRRIKAWVLEQETPGSDDETDHDRAAS